MIRSKDWNILEREVSLDSILPGHRIILSKKLNEGTPHQAGKSFLEYSTEESLKAFKIRNDE